MRYCELSVGIWDAGTSHTTIVQDHMFGVLYGVMVCPGFTWLGLKVLIPVSCILPCLVFCGGLQQAQLYALYYQSHRNFNILCFRYRAGDSSYEPGAPIQVWLLHHELSISMIWW